MRNSKAAVTQRREHILELLKRDTSIRVNDLADTLAVSQLTVRRDLEQLESEGRVKRMHGEARIIDPAIHLTYRGDEHLLQMQAVGAAAARMVEDGDTIFVNSGRTAVYVMQNIKKRDVFVVTTNLRALIMEQNPNLHIMLTGGEFSDRFDSLVGEFAVNPLNQVVSSKCFLGVIGISAAGGLTTSSPKKIVINKTMIARCKGPKIVVADGSKIGNSTSFYTCPVTDISCLVTDTSADPEELQRIRNTGVEVVVVDPYAPAP